LNCDIPFLSYGQAPDTQTERQTEAIPNAHSLMGRDIIRFATKPGDEYNSIKHRRRGAMIEGMYNR